ncbi:MAG: NAD(P)-dependent oxidoreductase [Chloroflexi bacterium]|nr:NAD(P)-dependent oxidoreductase [Chloroflexota bacterium]
MNVLVTGGAGYVGTSLVPLLLERGYKVRVFDNLMFGGAPVLPFFRNQNFQFINGDIRNKDDIVRAMKDQDIVVHLAAIVGYPACRKEPILAEQVNIGGVDNLIGGVSKDQLVLFSSTGSNYGCVEGICTEETPLNPLSLYGQTKTVAERRLLENSNAIVYRFATAFGISPRMRLDLLINDFVYRALTEGYLVVYESQFRRTFIHVHDMCRAFLFAIDHADKMAGQVYNVGSEKMNLSKRDVCEQIAAKINCHVHYADVGEDQDKRDYVVSYHKINSLGYQTTVTVDEGIDELIRALRVVQIKTPYSNV